MSFRQKQFESVKELEVAADRDKAGERGKPRIIIRFLVYRQRRDCVLYLLFLYVNRRASPRIGAIRSRRRTVRRRPLTEKSLLIRQTQCKYCLYRHLSSSVRQVINW
jgi:hypothetical protein